METTHGFGALFDFRTLGLNQLNNAKNQLIGLSKTTDVVLDNIQRKMLQFGAITAVGLGTMALGKAGLNQIDKAVNQFALIETLMVQLKHKVKLGKDEFNELAKEINRVGAVTKYSGQETWEAANNLVGYGLTGEQVKESIQSVLFLANATEELPKVAGDSLSQMRNVFSEMTFEDLANQIMVAKNTTAFGTGAGISEIQYLAKAVAGFRSDLAMASKEAIAFNAVFRGKGASDADSAEYIKALGRGMMEFTTNAKKMSMLSGIGKKYGIEVELRNADGTRKSFMETFKILYNLMNTLKKDGKEGMIAYQQVMDTLFTFRKATAGYGIMAGELDNLGGIEYLQKLADSFDPKNIQGELTKMVEDYNKTLTGMKEVNEGLVDSIYELIGSGVIGYYKKIQQLKQDLLTGIVGWLNIDQESAKDLAKFIAFSSIALIVIGAVFTLVGGLGLASLALAKFGGAMAIAKMGMLALGKGLLIMIAIVGVIALVYYLWKNWDNISPMIQKIIYVLGGLVAIIGLAKLVMIAFNVVSAMNPIVWIVGLAIIALIGLVAVGVWMYDNWDMIMQGLKDLWDGFVGALEWGWEVLKIGFRNVFDWIMDKINSVLKWIANVIQMLPQWMVSDGMFQWSANMLKNETVNQDVNRNYTGNAFASLENQRNVAPNEERFTKKEYIFHNNVEVKGKDLTYEEIENLKKGITEANELSFLKAMETN